MSFLGTGIKDRISHSNKTLIELIMGIIAVTIAAAIVGAIVSPAKLVFLYSLLLGMAGAMLMVSHMSVTISRELDLPPDAANRHARIQYMIRLILLILALLCALKISWLDFIGFFIGLMTLKAAVYLQPLMHKLLTKQKKEGE